MTERTVTQRELEALLRRLDRLERRVGLVEVIEKLGYTPPTAFTPTYIGATTAGTTTYTIQEGSYIRIASLVVARAQLNWTNATGTGAVRLGGLPFAAASDAAFAIRSTGLTFANGSVEGVLLSGNTQAQLFSPVTNAAATELAIEAAGNIRYTIVYFV